MVCAQSMEIIFIQVVAVYYNPMSLTVILKLNLTRLSMFQYIRVVHEINKERKGNK